MSGAKRATAALLAAALCLALSACGGSQSSTGTTSSATTAGAAGRGAASGQGQGVGEEGRGGPRQAPRAQVQESPGAGGSKQGVGKGPGAAREVIPPALKRKAGKAAPFLATQGDNSIPTYGSEGSSSESSEAAASLSAYLTAREAGQWSSACIYMSTVLQRQVQVLFEAAGGQKPATCAAAYGKLSQASTPRERADPLVSELVSFRVNGDHAFALFYGAANQKYMMPMASEGGAWKVNQIAPVAYPVGVSVTGG